VHGTEVVWVYKYGYKVWIDASHYEQYRTYTRYLRVWACAVGMDGAPACNWVKGTASSTTNYCGVVLDGGGGGGSGGW